MAKTGEDNCRLPSHLGWHNDRGSVLRFLGGPAMDLTNERLGLWLRGAARTPQVPLCSETAGSAETHSAFAGVIGMLERAQSGQLVTSGLAQGSVALRL